MLRTLTKKKTFLPKWYVIFDRPEKKKTFESFDLSEKPGISFKIIFSESYNSGMPDALETKFDICISSYIQASQNGNSNF